MGYSWVIVVTATAGAPGAREILERKVLSLFLGEGRWEGTADGPGSRIGRPAAVPTTGWSATLGAIASRDAAVTTGWKVAPGRIGCAAAGAMISCSATMATTGCSGVTVTMTCPAAPAAIGCSGFSAGIGWRAGRNETAWMAVAATTS